MKVKARPCAEGSRENSCARAFSAFENNKIVNINFWEVHDSSMNANR